MQSPSVVTICPLNWVARAIVAGVLLGAGAAAAERVEWVTGPALQQQLAQPIDVLWAENPLRQAVTRLSASCRVAILIDRRVDPGQKLHVSLRDVPLQQALQTIADERNLGVSRLGSMVYLGPRTTADHLRAVAAAFDKDTRRLPTAIQRKYRQLRPMEWPDLATPRELMADVARDAGIEITNLDKVPHDLWAAAQLPALSLTDRLTLLAIQFDLSFRVVGNGSRLELVSVPESLPLAAGPNGGLAGPSHTPASRRTAKPPAGQDRFQINVREKPLGPVLRQLAARLDLDLRIDEQAIRDAGVSLDQRVSVRLENATVDDVLRGLLHSTGLTFHRKSKVVEIVPSE
ncbi:MAG: STN domain-containing protein [Planctomycetaceae bacterium]|nr:STN domain-containing protein [Planctomycetaceae bacterium]